MPRKRRSARPLITGSGLLEAGHAQEALVLLQRIAQPTPASHLLSATAYAALGQPDAARAQCQAGLQLKPDDPRLKLRLASLQTVTKKT